MGHGHAVGARRCPIGGAVNARPTLVLVGGVMFISAGSATLVNVVLPAVARDLAVHAGAIGPVVTVYFVVLAVGIPLSGRAAGRHGLRRCYVLGTATFALGSLACAVAPDVGALVAGRAVQAAGGAALPGLSLAAASRASAPSARGGSLGVVATSTGAGGVLAPLLGGWVGDVVGWRWLFVASGLLMALAVLPAHRMLPDQRRDVRGPLIPGSVLTNRDFWFAASAASCCAYAFVSAQVLVPLLLADVADATSRQIGAVLTPMAVGVAVTGVPAGRLADRFGPRTVLRVGSSSLAAGLLLTALTQGSFMATSLTMLLTGVGFGAVAAPAASAAASALGDVEMDTGLGIHQGLVFLGAGAGPATLVGAPHPVNLLIAAGAAGLVAVLLGTTPTTPTTSEGRTGRPDHGPAPR